MNKGSESKPTSNTVFENQRKSLMQHCERSEWKMPKSKSNMRHFEQVSNNVMIVAKEVY